MRTTKLKTKITIVIILILSATIGLGTWVNSTLFMQEYRAALEDNMFMIGENLKQQLDRLLALGISLTTSWVLMSNAGRLCRNIRMLSLLRC